MKCKNCQRENPDSAKFCVGCGAPLEAPVSFCANCGSKLDPSAKVCPSCGAQVISAAPVSAGSPQGTPQPASEYSTAGLVIKICAFAAAVLLGGLSAGLLAAGSVIGTALSIVGIGGSIAMVGFYITASLSLACLITGIVTPANRIDMPLGDRMLALLSYINVFFLPLFLIPQKSSKRSEFTDYHVGQGKQLYLGMAAATGILIVSGIIRIFLKNPLLFTDSLRNYIGYSQVVILVISVCGIYNVLRGKMKCVPGGKKSSN